MACLRARRVPGSVFRSSLVMRDLMRKPVQFNKEVLHPHQADISLILNVDLKVASRIHTDNGNDCVVIFMSPMLQRSHDASCDSLPKIPMSASCGFSPFAIYNFVRGQRMCKMLHLWRCCVPASTGVPRTKETAPAPRAAKGPQAYCYFGVLGRRYFLRAKFPCTLLSEVGMRDPRDYLMPKLSLFKKKIPSQWWGSQNGPFLFRE